MALKDMHMSKKGLDLLKHYEQGPNGGHAAKMYYCPAGKPTIGYGHVIILPQEQHLMTATITEEQALQMLAEDMIKYEADVKKYVKVDLTQDQFDALVSFDYNAGVQNFMTSTLLKKVNAKDFAGAAPEFDKWNKGRVKGVLTVLNGLVARRKTERLLFETGTLKFFN